MRLALGELTRYVGAGVVNSLVGYGVFLLMLHGAGLGPAGSNAVSYAVGLMVAYFMNLRFVFKTASHSGGAVARFLAGFALAYGLNLAVLHAAITFLKLAPELAQLLAMAAYTLSFYAINKFFVWRR